MSGDRRLAIHWFRRDLRISDHRALSEAARRAKSVLPVYILSDWKGRHPWTGARRQQFLCGALESLAANLSTIGGRLVIRCGEPVAELRRLLDESRAGLLSYTRDPDPHGRATEREVGALCRELDVEVIASDDVALHRADEVLTGEGEPYRVYTPYSRTWLSLDKPSPLDRPKNLDSPDEPDSLPLPTLDHWQLEAPDAGIVEAGERAARRRLDQALEDVIPDYAKHRDRPAVDGTSRLSQDLRWGLLSPRTVFAKVQELGDGADSRRSRSGAQKFIKELAWRDFYLAILGHFPEVLETEFNPTWRGLPWDEPGDRFDAWCRGRTGFPIVDAGMRQLLRTGWMHNRVRMITAMFLTKDLHIDWRFGEQFFMRHLVDGEIASNNGGWQWSAGTGADAAPYFRIQNPWLQSARHDPDGDYIRRWVPELAEVPAKRLAEAPADGRPVADDYPAPIVEHAAERRRTLAEFKRHKEQGG